MGDRSVLWNIDARGVATVVLNRPQVNNAYDETLIQGLLEAMDALGGEPSLRVVVLRGEGRHFQAGADLKWIRRVSAQSQEENERASRATARAVHRLNTLPVPTVALVQGGCFGGGTGIVAACDVVIAAQDAMFSIAETRWGLTAAIILPQLADAIGARQVRRYALTGERFGALEARRIGLVHEVVPPRSWPPPARGSSDQLLQNAPKPTPRPRRGPRVRLGLDRRSELRAPRRAARRQAPQRRRPPRASPPSPRSAPRAGSRAQKAKRSSPRRRGPSLALIWAPDPAGCRSSR
jgi:methylglutaconyl-CoA hydratase